MDVGELSSTAGLARSATIHGVAGVIGSQTPSNLGWWAPTPTSTIASAPANTDVMNQLCRVCGEPAAGFHFGAFTCEGCKSFFGRTYNNLSSISECKNGGVCVINKKNRTACKACRLRKCLLVGMSKSGSRYGRRSNWFKIHCLLQEQSHQVQNRIIKDTKSIYEKAFGPFDAANNNNINNNNESGTTANTNHANTVMNMINVANTTANSFMQVSERLRNVDDSKDQEAVKLPEQAQRVGSQEPASRSNELVRSPHEPLLRPEVAARFPMWRGPQFLYPNVAHMQLLNSPFLPFQSRFMIPYVNHANAQPTSVSSSSSDGSVSSRSTPSPKKDDEDPEQRDGSKGRTGPENAVYDKSLAYLKSLGPEQEAPIDLSMKAVQDRCKTESDDIATSEEEEEEEEDKSTDNDDNAISIQDTGPPLDLTRKT